MREPEPSKDPSRRLAEINRAITTSLNFDEVLDLIVENAAQLLEAKSVALLLVDRDGLLRIRASRGLDPRLATSFSGLMQEDVIKRLHEDFAVTQSESFLALPIIANNVLNGLLVARRDLPINSDEEAQLSALADQAAIAVRTAQLYEMELASAAKSRDETLEALKESNNRINTILESITDLFYSLDREWRFLEVNRQTELRFRKKREELLGQVIWELYPHAINSPLYPQLHKAMQEMVPVHFELASQIVPGLWFEVHAYPSPDGLSVYLRDISERRLTERATHLLASIVEQSHDAIISKNLKGVINSWNRGAERIFGYTAEEAIGQNVTMLIPEDRYDEEPAILARISEGNRVEHYETIRRRKDGQLIDISLSISPMFDESGNIIGASKIARDISYRKRRDREIRFQASLLDAVEQAVIATDLQGKIVYWNTFAERLYGWTTDEALGADVVAIVPADETREQAQEIFTAVREGKSWSGEILTRNKSGRIFPALVTDSPIFGERGELIGVVGVSIDISDQKRAEEERARLLEREQAARAEAEQANRLKDEFLATLSHELRNPLNVILGYSEVLLRSEDVKNSRFLHRAVEVLRRNAIAQAHLVRDLLDLSRLHMGKVMLNREAVSLAATVANAVETVSAEASEKNIQIGMVASGDMLFVDADPLRLEQIIWNLLNNAVKFTPPGGKVTVRLGTDRDLGIVQVEDTGQGIDPAFLPHVFEMFRQADATSSRKHAGMGIGLALVQQLVQLHNGSVSVSSDGEGRGASFEVRIPLSREVKQSLPSPTVEAGVLSRLRILVVDDSLDTLDMLKRLFEMDGAIVETAKSGIEALQVLEKQKFDVILSDISMPGMDGFELLRRLRALPEAAEVPVLALTGFGRAEDVERAHAEGFFSHVTKPIDLVELLDMLQNLPARA